MIDRNLPYRFLRGQPLKNPLWVFNIKNMVYTIYVPSLSQGLKSSAKNWTFQSQNVLILRNDFISKSFDCNKENGPKCLNFLNVLIHYN